MIRRYFITVEEQFRAGDPFDMANVSDAVSCLDPDESDEVGIADPIVAKTRGPVEIIAFKHRPPCTASQIICASVVGPERRFCCNAAICPESGDEQNRRAPT
jgi:hypothetical protein